MGALEAQGPCEIGGAMKAIRVHTFGGSEVLQLDDVPDPTPGPGQVVGRVRAVSVPYGTAYRGLHHKAHARPGETLLVHGASGGVGVAAVQLAVAHGMTVIGTAGTERGRRLVQEHGAHQVLDHTAPDYLKKLIELTGNHVANVNLQKDIDVVARFGRIVVIGNRGTIEINPRGTMGKDAAIFGLALWNAAPEEMASIHAALGGGLANGTLRPVVGQELPLKEAARAHEAVLKPGAYGKIILIP